MDIDTGTFTFLIILAMAVFGLVYVKNRKAIGTSDKLICRSCGEANLLVARFCRHCGAKIN